MWKQDFQTASSPNKWAAVCMNVAGGLPIQKILLLGCLGGSAGCMWCYCPLPAKHSIDTIFHAVCCKYSFLLEMCTHCLQTNVSTRIEWSMFGSGICIHFESGHRAEQRIQRHSWGVEFPRTLENDVVALFAVTWPCHLWFPIGRNGFSRDSEMQTCCLAHREESGLECLQKSKG